MILHLFINVTLGCFGKSSSKILLLFTLHLHYTVHFYTGVAVRLAKQGQLARALFALSLVLRSAYTNIQCNECEGFRLYY